MFVRSIFYADTARAAQLQIGIQIAPHLYYNGYRSYFT